MNTLTLGSHTNIGVFDSGIGGLSILKELIKIPGLNLTYFADNAHVPYGNKSPEEIKRLSSNAVKFLIQQDVTLIIIACHTVSTQALDYLKIIYPQVDFIGTPELILQQTSNIPESKTLGIIGTQATIQSGVLERIIQTQNPSLKIISQPCPQLATLIEHEIMHQDKIKTMLDTYLVKLVQEKIDLLVLGCTHYALIQTLIRESFAYEIQLISAEQSIAQLNSESFHIETNEPKLSFFVSGNSDKFCHSCLQFLGFEPENINLIPQSSHYTLKTPFEYF